MPSLAAIPRAEHRAGVRGDTPFHRVRVTDPRVHRGRPDRVRGPVRPGLLTDPHRHRPANEARLRRAKEAGVRRIALSLYALTPEVHDDFRKVSGSWERTMAILRNAGTVLGRLVSAELSFAHVTTLRFFFGLLALVLFALASRTPVRVPEELIPRLVALAAIPGLLALAMYYFALRRTPASRATLAELAFPLTAAFVGVTLLIGSLDVSQWAGFFTVLTSVALLANHEPNSRRPAVAVPANAEDAVAIGGR